MKQRLLKKHIKKLDIKRGDIVLVKGISKYELSALIHRMKILGNDLTFIVVGEESDLIVLSEQEMEKFGWIRKPQAENQ